MAEFDCKKCLHEKVCALWASRESQDASCFCTDGCDYFTPTLTPPNEPLTIEQLREMGGHLMDIEKLIERLRKHRIIYKTNYDEFSGGACTADCVDAADIISTLQAENEKLRAELEQVKRKRLHELAQADREGRCVVLPAKPDQTIYQWRKGDDCPSVSRLDGVQINADGEITYPIWNGYLIPEDFGRTVFLTREEAALRREQE